MTSDIEQRRLAHPQARLFPKIVWSSFFSYQDASFVQAIFTLMQASEEMLDDAVDKFFKNEYFSGEAVDFEEKVSAWLAIAYAHPEFSDATLQRYLDSIGVNALDECLSLMSVYGRVSLVRGCFERCTNDESRQTMLQAEHYTALYSAAEYGHLDVVRYLYARQKALDETKCQAMLESDSYDAFCVAAENGHLAIVRFFYETQKALDDTKCQAMLEEKHYSAFLSAVENGHLDVARYLYNTQNELNPEKCQDMLQAGDYHAFRLAIENGHLEVAQYLYERQKALDKTACQAMLQAKDNHALHLAVINGHLDVIRFLYETQKDLDVTACQAMLRGIFQRQDHGIWFGNTPFSYAAGKGYLNVVQYLYECQKTLDKTKCQTVLQARDYEALCSAAAKGQQAVVHYLYERQKDLNEAKCQTMLEADGYYAFRMAADKGHLDVVRYLYDAQKTLDKTKCQAMLQAEKNYAFCTAAENGHLAVVQFLYERQKALNGAYYCQAMIDGAFPLAVEYGHLEVVRYLYERQKELDGTKCQALLGRCSGYLFDLAIENEHLSVFEYLYEQQRELDDAELASIVALDGCSAFKLALSHNKEAFAKTLFLQPNVFKSIAAQGPDYSERYIHPFVTRHLTRLRHARTSIVDEDARVFDLEDETEIKLCFYMIRHLISRNTPEVADDIRFLVAIPGVNRSLHLEMTPGEPNELFRLAVRLNNEYATRRLLTSPQVRATAREQEQHRDAEENGGFGLRALAEDPEESSMLPLSESEEARLQALREYYSAVLEEKTVPVILNDLEAMLLERYAQNPAVVDTTDGRTGVRLPASWDAWSELARSFNADTREQALQAYYQHTVHTAWRYLQRPNPWIVADSEYTLDVYSVPSSDGAPDVVTQDKVEPAPSREAIKLGSCAHFDGYQPLIAMFYLAAKDNTVVPTDGSFTVDVRLTFFIQELEMLAREHNRDYLVDDGMPDNPSCCLGVRRRLFQSAPGHPLLIAISENDLKLEVISALNSHVKAVIKSKSLEELRTLKKACDNVCEGQLDEAGSLNVFNFDEAEQTAFIAAITARLRDHFEKDPSLERFLREKAFQINAIYSTHVERYGLLTGVSRMLDDAIQAQAVSASEAMPVVDATAGEGTPVLSDSRTTQARLGQAERREYYVRYYGGLSVFDPNGADTDASSATTSDRVSSVSDTTSRV